MAGLDQEREVVLEEIAMYEDDPDDIVHDHLARAVYPDDPLGRPVIGTAAVIESMTLETLRRHHQTFYIPENMAVVACGRIEHAALVAAAEGELGSLQPAPRPPRAAAGAPAAGTFTFSEKKTEQYHLCLGAPGVSSRDPRRFAAALLDQMLGLGYSSRLFQEIRERRGMAYSVYSFANQFVDAGFVGAFMGTREENVAACLDIYSREIGALAAGAFRDGELDRARQALCGRVSLGMESPGARMDRLGRCLVLDLELVDEDAVVEHIKAVTEDEVRSLAEALYAPGRISLASIGPRRSVVEHAAAAAGLGGLG